MPDLTFTVYGNPLPKGSMRCVGRRGGRAHVVIDNNPAVAVWQREVRAIAALGGAAYIGVPVTVDITSVLARPKAHYRTGRNSHLLRAGAPLHPIGRGTGDADKLARLVLDALEGAGVVFDDAQVIDVRSRKEYVPPMGTPGVIVRVHPLEE